MKMPYRLLWQLGVGHDAKPRLNRPAYAGRHEGATVLILASGPSLRDRWAEIDALRRTQGAITIGANNVADFICPDYHAFTNRKRFVQFAGTIDPTRSRVLLGTYLPPVLIRAHYQGPYESIMYVNVHDRPFGIENGVIQASCRTIAVLLVAVALVMGARRIFVAGTDGYKEILARRGQIHHYADALPKDAERQQKNDAYLLDVEQANSRFLDEIAAHQRNQGLEPFRIVTPTTYQRHYQDINDFL